MGNITIQGDLTGDVPGGEVGGASNLTTVGAIPYVSAAKTLNQDPTALFWDAANDRLGVGRNNPSTVLHVEAANPAVTVTRTAISNLTIANGGSGVWSYTANGGQGLSFGITGGAEWARLAPSTGNLLIGTTTDDTTNKLQVVGTYQAAFLSASGSSNNCTRIDSANGARVYQTNASGTVVNLIQSSSSASYFNAGNVLIGTTTDSNYKLDVGASGASGTLRVYDQTPTTGVTKAVIRAGAGQGATNLTEWQNSAGTKIASVSSIGTIRTAVFETNSDGLYIKDDGNEVLAMGYSWRVTWGVGSAGSTADSGIKRSAAGVLEIDSGTAGAYRDLILRRLQMGGQTVSQLPAAAAGNAGSTQYVTDATATTISSVVVGGGSNKVLVWSDGTSWKIMAN